MASDSKISKLACLNVQSWRPFTKQEILEKLEHLRERDRGRAKRTSRKGSGLAVRHAFSPVDIYTYLKARFGGPNGMQTFLREDDSDNLFHWDFWLKAGSQDVLISGMSREIHFQLSESLSDADWHSLIRAIKIDFARVGKEKSEVLQSLEKWVIFRNRYVEIADICADLHAHIADNMGGYHVSRPSTRTRKVINKHLAEAKKLGERANRLHTSCLQLSLITPILVEAFLNMLILLLCKKEIRNNKRQFDAFIRSQIDTKVFDLFYKCERFSRSVDASSAGFKRFKSIMDRRNHAIHANVNPPNEYLEIVYFEKRRPLFVESGDHLGRFFETLERQYNPQEVIKDYEDMHAFILDIVDCLVPGAEKEVWAFMRNPYPGYDVNRQKLGVLFPDVVSAAYFGGLRYDDELT